MITVTLNPSLDRTLDVEGLEVGEVNRAVGTHLDAGGKGINVSRGLHQHGLPTVAVFPLGGADGQVLVSQLAASGVPVRPVPIAGSTRTNITVADSRPASRRRSTPPGRRCRPTPSSTPCAMPSPRSSIAVRGGVVVAGSLPDGVPPTILTRLARLAADRGVPYAVDTSGPRSPRPSRPAASPSSSPTTRSSPSSWGASSSTVGDVLDAASGGPRAGQ